MGMFDQFNNVFSVGNTISQTANTQPDDVLKTKSALAQTGDYKVPDYGLTDIPDMGMIDGLKKFQQKNGLKVDGIMKPGGPTEKTLRQSLANQDLGTTDFQSNNKQTLPSNIKVRKSSDNSWSASASFVQKTKSNTLPKLEMGPTNSGKIQEAWNGFYKQQAPKDNNPIIPKGQTVDQRIRSMMQDNRYQDKQDTSLREHVIKQFKRAYPDNVEYDETGKMFQAQAVIEPHEVEPFEPKNRHQATSSNIAQAEKKENQSNEDQGSDCNTLKEDMNQAYKNWEDADGDYQGKSGLFQDQVKIADQAWDDLIDTISGTGVSEDELPDKPEHGDEKKEKKNRYTWTFFKEILKRFLTAFEFGKYLEDVSKAYWNYDEALKALERLRQEAASTHKTQLEKWGTYSDIKKEYERKCGK